MNATIKVPQHQGYFHVYLSIHTGCALASKWAAHASIILGKDFHIIRSTRLKVVKDLCGHISNKQLLRPISTCKKKVFFVVVVFF